MIYQPKISDENRVRQGQGQGAVDLCPTFWAKGSFESKRFNIIEKLDY